MPSKGVAKHKQCRVKFSPRISSSLNIYAGSPIRIELKGICIELALFEGLDKVQFQHINKDNYHVNIHYTKIPCCSSRMPIQYNNKD